MTTNSFDLFKIEGVIGEGNDYPIRYIFAESYNHLKPLVKEMNGL